MIVYSFPDLPELVKHLIVAHVVLLVPFVFFWGTVHTMVFLRGSGNTDFGFNHTSSSPSTSATNQTFYGMFDLPGVHRPLVAWMYIMIFFVGGHVWYRSCRRWNPVALPPYPSVQREPIYPMDKYYLTHLAVSNPNVERAYHFGGQGYRHEHAVRQWLANHSVSVFSELESWPELERPLIEITHRHFSVPPPPPLLSETLDTADIFLSRDTGMQQDARVTIDHMHIYSEPAYAGIQYVEESEQSWALPSYRQAYETQNHQYHHTVPYLRYRAPDDESYVPMTRLFRRGKIVVRLDFSPTTTTTTTTTNTTTTTTTITKRETKEEDTAHDTKRNSQEPTTFSAQMLEVLARYKTLTTIVVRHSPVSSKLWASFVVYGDGVLHKNQIKAFHDVERHYRENADKSVTTGANRHLFQDRDVNDRESYGLFPRHVILNAPRPRYGLFDVSRYHLVYYWNTVSVQTDAMDDTNSLRELFLPTQTRHHHEAWLISNLYSLYQVVTWLCLFGAYACTTLFFSPTTILDNVYLIHVCLFALVNFHFVLFDMFVY